jgi:hypothetical protein
MAHNSHKTVLNSMFRNIFIAGDYLLKNMREGFLIPFQVADINVNHTQYIHLFCSRFPNERTKSHQICSRFPNERANHIRFDRNFRTNGQIRASLLVRTLRTDKFGRVSSFVPYETITN